MNEQPLESSREADEDWTDCDLCRDVFGRRRVTTRRCRVCARGFCEGEHGRQTLCILCLEPARDQDR